MNPAVTLANCLTGHTSWGRGGLYMAAQLLGAIFGALIEVIAHKACTCYMHSLVNRTRHQALPCKRRQKPPALLHTCTT